MAFRISVDDSTDKCDACGESDAKISPKLHIREKSSGMDSNWIFIHVHCFMEQSARALRKFHKQ